MLTLTRRFIVICARGPLTVRELRQKLNARPEALALALALLPVVAALVSEAWLTHARPAPRGDQAIIELHLRRALQGRHLLGPSSQYGWFHPGPLLYYLLAPLYLLSGSASGSLYFSAGLVNLLALGGMAAVHFKLTPEPRARLVFCLLLAACVAAFVARVPEGAFVANPLTEIWNPAITVLPFGLLLVTGAGVAAGHLELTPLLVLLHAGTTQSHISYVPAATAVLLLAVGCGARGQRKLAPGSGSRAWRSLAASGALALILWLPPLIAALHRQPGSALAVLRFFVEDRHERLLPGVALPYALRELHWPLLTLLGVEGGVATWLAALLTALQLGGTAAALRKPFRNEEPYVAALALLVAVVTLIAVLQATQLMSLSRGVYYYQTLWYCVVGCLGWSGGALVLARALASSGHFGRFALVLGAVALVSSAVSLGVVRRDFQRCRLAKPPEPEPALLAARAVKPLFATNEANPRYELDAVSDGAWGVLSAIALELDKQGVVVRVAKRWRPILGSGVSYRERSPATLQIALEPLHTAPLWQTFGSIGLYLPEPVRRTESSLNRPDPLAVERQASTLTATLPPADDGEFVAGIELECNGNATYLVEGSEDARTFVALGESLPTNHRGPGRRAFYFNDHVVWKVVRLSPTRGHRSTIGEVWPMVSQRSAVEPLPRAQPR